MATNLRAIAKVAVPHVKKGFGKKTKWGISPSKLENWQALLAVLLTCAAILAIAGLWYLIAPTPKPKERLNLQDENYKRYSARGSDAKHPGDRPTVAEQTGLPLTGGADINADAAKIDINDPAARARDAAQAQADSAQAQVGSAVDQASAEAKGGVGATNEASMGLADRAKQTGSDLSSKGQGLAQDAKSSAQGAMDQASSGAGDAAGSAKDAASGLGGKIQDAGNSAAGNVQNAAGDVNAAAGDAGNQASAAVNNAAEGGEQSKGIKALRERFQ